MNKTEAAIRKALRGSAFSDPNREIVEGFILATEVPGAELHGVEVYVRGVYQMALGWLYNGLIANVVMDYTTGEIVRSEVEPDQVAIFTRDRNASAMISQWLGTVPFGYIPASEIVRRVRSREKP